MEARVTYILITFLVLCCIAKASNTSTTKPHAKAQVPCFFVFGDSLVDHGNNNDIITLVKSNFWPYGIDFPLGATGRFSNGRTIIDFLTRYLGITHFIPPSSRARKSDFIKGVNFATGAAGIRNETGDYLGATNPLDQQVSNFAVVVGHMREHFKGDEKALHNHLSKCIFYSGLGNNDYLNNYFMPLSYSTSEQFTPQEFAKELIRDYTRQLTALYNFGVRKVIISGIGQMGCIPLKVEKDNGTNEIICEENENYAVQLFNSALRDMVDSFNNGQLMGAKFVFLDHFKCCKDVISNRSFYGLEVVDKGCCGVGKNTNGGEFTCLPLQTPCDERKKYAFWDAFHPSEAVHQIFAEIAYTTNSSSYAYPMNIKQLAML